MRGLAAGMALAAFMPSAALACSTPSYEESGLVIQADNLARQMVEAAAVVELVEVDSITPWDTKASFAEERADALANVGPEWTADVSANYDNYEHQYRIFGASTVTFRVVESLKGAAIFPLSVGAFVIRNGNDSFNLGPLTDRLPADGPSPSAEDLYEQYALTDLRHFGGSGSCAAPLVVKPNGRYLVFRDAAGDLMRDAIPAMSSNRSDRAGVDEPNFEAVDQAGDAWLDAVRIAVATPPSA
jgi:hypothetical protein